MMSDNSEPSDGVSVSMSLSGEYNEVMSKLRIDTTGADILEPLLADAEAVLEAVDQLDGGTRSVVAEQLTDESSLSDDADAVVTLLQVLERYELVHLDGNTWKPGARLRE